MHVLWYPTALYKAVHRPAVYTVPTPEVGEVIEDRDRVVECMEMVCPRPRGGGRRPPSAACANDLCFGSPVPHWGRRVLKSLGGGGGGFGKRAQLTGPLISDYQRWRQRRRKLF